MLSQAPDETKAQESSERYWLLQDLNSKRIRIVDSKENLVDREILRFRDWVAKLTHEEPRNVLVEKFGPFKSKEEVKKEKEVLADTHFAVYVDEATGQVESIEVDNFRNFKADVLMGKNGKGNLSFEKEFFGPTPAEAAKAAEEYAKKRREDFKGEPQRAA